MKKSPAIGLALSGGAVRGIAHVAVLESLEEQGIPLNAVAGTSAGSIVGALYAAGMPLGEIRDLAVKTAWKNIFRPTIPRAGLFSSEGVYSFMNKVLPVKRFSSLKIPFAAVAAELRNAEKVVITSGSVARAVQASCSLPIVFTPTKINNRILIDGGVVSLVPVRAVREELGAKRCIAVNVNYRAVEKGRYENMIQIAAHLSSLLAAANAGSEEVLADVVIRVSARGIGLFDILKASELLKRGRSAAEEQAAALKAMIKDDA